MYLGFFLGWIGLWMVFGEANVVTLAPILILIVAASLFVIFYEEPTLRARFGDEYEQYCRNVPRWSPRLKPWNG